MFGGFHSWFSTSLAGIDTSTNATVTGWRHIVISPDKAAILRLEHASASLDTRFGLTNISWIYSKKAGHFHLNVTVPVGTTAEVHFPQLGTLDPVQIKDTRKGGFGIGDDHAVWHSGRWLPSAPLGLHNIKRISHSGATVLELGSGFYQLSALYQ